MSQRIADSVARFGGSWSFIITFAVILAVYTTANVLLHRAAWDPYPFILLNLLLSLQAAYTAPIIMMSQNREAQLDRLRAEHDYQINVKAEEEIRVVLEHLEAQSVILQKLIEEMKAKQ